MNMKNKLFKHHKSKAFFYVRNISFVFLGLVGIGLSIAIPTYISSIKEQQIAAKAQAEEEEKENNVLNHVSEEFLKFNY